MKRKFNIKLLISFQGKFAKLRKLLQILAYGLSFFLGIWLVCTAITLAIAVSQPVDSFFVLGGSISREIYVAKLAKQHPQTPILISRGSADRCLWLIFQRETASLQNVWLEKCANSTFENFYYSIPILHAWKAHKVRLITSPTHLPRAKLLAQILLGAHGIWVETEIVPEQGIPGNRESWLKTGLDVTRSLVWAVFSQVIQPQCSNVVRLAEVDMLHEDVKCEHQGGLER
ncbi:MAG: YdcF family protein [Desmonostoc vinosum HA7617-LM4]|jgi:uncharacterized SAM-binding protein YcdF (DUF218 family)|nr:YdcF family protein [Desmonostoc vinosum HA7617-LM4]